MPPAAPRTVTLESCRREAIVSQADTEQPPELHRGCNAPGELSARTLDQKRARNNSENLPGEQRPRRHVAGSCGERTFWRRVGRGRDEREAVKGRWIEPSLRRIQLGGRPRLGTGGWGEAGGEQFKYLWHQNRGAERNQKIDRPAEEQRAAQSKSWPFPGWSTWRSLCLFGPSGRAQRGACSEFRERHGSTAVISEKATTSIT